MTRIKLINMLIILGLAGMITSCATVNNERNSSDSTGFEIPTIVRFARIYGGGSERNPPILLIRDEKSKYSSPIGYGFLTLEFDIYTEILPAMIVKFYHCDVNWKETDNSIITNNIFNRTSDIDWTTSTFYGDYHSHRGKVKFPNYTAKFEYSGNYKAKIFLMDNENEPLAEVRFFVVKPQSATEMRVYPTFYEPKYKVANTGLILETIVGTDEAFFDDRMHYVVYYRNNRYYEPYHCTKGWSVGNISEKLYTFALHSMVSGYSAHEKRFRLEGLPSENVYRIMNTTNPVYFPRTSEAVRFPFSDLSRNGTFNERDDNGCLITDYVSNSNDDYVNVEFVLDPESFVADGDIFISGSFNNWKPDKNWIMTYDEKSRLFKCRNWIRRGRHNYLYGTGKYNINTNSFEQYSFEYYEGNTSYSMHSFYGFVYYRNLDFGAYDSIIGVAVSDNNGGFR